MKRTLYLHIGRPKVGSSALQHFLFENRDALKKKGMLYPEVGMHHNASHKFALIYQPERPDHKIVKGVAPQELFNQLLSEVEQSKAQKVIISSEHFFLVDPELLPKSLLRDFDVKIICYARRQDEVLISSYFQEVKMGRVEDGGDIFKYAKHPLRLSLLDYKPVLDSWSERFGQNNIMLRVFEDLPTAPSIFQDFMNAIGEPMDGLKMPERRLNASLPRDVFEFLRMIELYSDSKYRRFPLWSTLRRIAEDFDEAEGFDSKTLFPNSLRKELLDKFKESNAAIARDYLGREDGVLFSGVDFTQGDVDYAGITFDRFVSMSAGVLALQRNQLLQLHNRVVALEGALEGKKAAEEQAIVSAKSNISPVRLVKRIKRGIQRRLKIIGVS